MATHQSKHNDDMSNSFALLIGVPDKKLPSERDAADIAKVLIENAGYPTENVFLLTGEQASKPYVISAFDELAQLVDPDSKVILYYSGHGHVIEKDNVESYYLCVHGFDLDRPETTGVTAPEIKGKLNNLVAEQLVFFFDCCHAQGMTKGGGVRAPGEKIELLEAKADGMKTSEGLVQNVDDEEGMAIISSCKDHQTSIYFSGEDNSVFTKHLLTVLKGDHTETTTEGAIRLLDVISYIIKAVPEDVALDNLEQTPFINAQFDKNFELSRVGRSKGEKRAGKDIIKALKSKALAKKAVQKYYRDEQSNNAILFVHGFSGEAHKSFGVIPHLLIKEKALDGWDMFPFGFNANIKPELGQQLWASEADINRIADNLGAKIKHRFSKYDRIALIGYSLGGLALQKALLDLNDEQLKRVSHVLLFGCPNAGLSKTFIAQNKLNGELDHLTQGNAYITSIRKRWKKRFEKGYPFDFKVVAGTKDRLIPLESNFGPFEKEHQYTVSGNHLSMVNVQGADNDSFLLIKNALTNNPFTNQFTNSREINLMLGKYDKVIDELLESATSLKEEKLEDLIEALESTGRRNEAIAILEKHELGSTDADIIQVLGDLYKNSYLENDDKGMAKAAVRCYRNALQLAKVTDQQEQLCKNYMDLAFMSLVYYDNKERMLSYAKKGIAAVNYPFEDSWELITLAEGHLYLKQLDLAMDYYTKVAEIGDIHLKIACYNSASKIYHALYPRGSRGVNFKGFLTENFLR